MAQIVTFEDDPPARYDSLPWTRARVERQVVSDDDPPVTTWETVETDDFSSLDVLPAYPATRRVTFTGEDGGTYRIVWIDAAAAESAPSSALTVADGGPLCSVEEVQQQLKGSTPPAGALELRIAAASDRIRIFTKTPYGLTRPVPSLLRLAAATQSAAWYLIDSSRLADSFQNELGEAAPGPKTARGLSSGVLDMIEPFRKITIG